MLRTYISYDNTTGEVREIYIIGQTEKHWKSDNNWEKTQKIDKGKYTVVRVHPDIVQNIRDNKYLENGRTKFKYKFDVGGVVPKLKNEFKGKGLPNSLTMNGNVIPKIITTNPEGQI